MRFGLPIADPIAGILITIVIATVVYSTSRSVLQRLLDAVDPHIVPSIIDSASKVPGVDVRLATSISETLFTYQYLILYQAQGWPGNMC